MRRIIGMLSLVALAACRYQPTPITLQGDPFSIATLRGDWSGEYWSNVSERRGALTFTLA